MFVRDKFSPLSQYSCVLELGRNNWAGYDFVSRQKKELADNDLLFAGFECDDASHLSKNSADLAVLFSTAYDLPVMLIKCV